MPVDVKIKKATNEDFHALKNLMLSALKTDPTAFSVDYYDYAQNPDSWWSNYLWGFLNQFSSVMLLGMESEIPAGMVGVIYDNKSRRKHIASIVWFYVKPEYRGKGLGSKLMDQILSEINSKEGIKKITLLMNETQSEALKIYKKLGFENTGVLKNEMLINDEYVDEYILEKMINE